MLIGCIADDFTGGTDVASVLAQQGLSVVQTIDVPSTAVPAVDAVVIALKSRTVPPADAVAQSIAAARWLSAQGCERVYFKYCSTFDSTDAGNIGPVADALGDLLGEELVIACPAYPANARSLFNGHLFVGDTLLSETGMRNHPLTPMRDANLVRVLQRQSSRRVGLVDHAVVRRGDVAVRVRLDELRRSGDGLAIVDAVDDRDLATIGKAAIDRRLTSGGAGLALGLARALAERGEVSPPADAGVALGTGLRRAVIAGSASEATNRQVAALRERYPAFRVDPMAIAAGEDVVGAALAWATDHLGADPLCIYATADAAAVKAVQDRLGVAEAGALVERTLAAIARELVERGCDALIVAGGETSGAVVQALGITMLRIGPAIAPGVPWTVTQVAGRPLALALKSGNFGGPDFFLTAWDHLR